jgi:hypothetical protein
MNTNKDGQIKPARSVLKTKLSVRKKKHTKLKLIIEFIDAVDLLDSWKYAEQIGLGVEFERAIIKLIRMSLSQIVTSEHVK